MCTYVTIRSAITGSAKGPGTPWRHVSDMCVYLDHPVHALESHTVNVDLTGADPDPAARIALELSPESARQLAHSILDLLAAAPELSA